MVAQSVNELVRGKENELCPRIRYLAMRPLAPFLNS
jgi:hypothetical protein